MQAPVDQRPRSGDSAPYDLNIINEVIVNAVARRGHAIFGSKSRLFLFAEEIYSPGKLPNTPILDDMP